MNYNSLLKCIIFLLFSFLTYKYHINWRKRKIEEGSMDTYDKTVRVVRRWGMIVISLACAFLYLLKALNLI